MRRITVDSMVTVVFTGDSQTTGRNLAIDYPQLLSRVLPIRVINTAVGGSNSNALVKPMTGGSIRGRRGERLLYGTSVSWGMGPYPGMRVTIQGEVYTIDAVAEHPPTRNTELHLTEPLRADVEGADYSIDPGWAVRVADHRPQVVCLMYVNDGAMAADRQENWREMIARLRAMNAVPVLMSPFPPDDASHGGSHPSYHDNSAQNARVVRELAVAEKAWFVDVFNLTLALDPPLRCQVGDGIHPDTDGQTLAIDGLLWAFDQMGLTRARPFIKGWVLNAEAGAIDATLANGARAFRISQPDHPEPDRQDEKGFTLEAIRSNDEVGLIAAADGAGVALGAHGVVLGIGLEHASRPRQLRLELTGTSLSAVRAWQPATATWAALATAASPDGLTADLPLDCLDDNTAAVLITGGDGASLDAAALAVDDDITPAPWQPAAVTPGAYVLESDHARPGNLVSNPDVTAGAGDDASGWRLRDARANRPSRTAVTDLAFGDEKDLRWLRLAGPPAPRPFDLIAIRGSQAGNDGLYRVRSLHDDGRVRLRRRAQALEGGLAGEIIHDDGCGLVPGGCCLEIDPGGLAETTLTLTDAGSALDLALFTRVIDPSRLGTRDLPGRQSAVTLTFLDADGAALGEPLRLPFRADSFQWRQQRGTATVPPAARQARLAITARGPGRLQITGVSARQR